MAEKKDAPAGQRGRLTEEDLRKWRQFRKESDERLDELRRKREELRKQKKGVVLSDWSAPVTFTTPPSGDTSETEEISEAGRGDPGARADEASEGSGSTNDDEVAERQD